MLSAITTATACPTKRTVSGAIAGQAPIFIGVPSLEVMAQPQIRLPTLSSTSSLPVSTAITPGIFMAADESMLLTLACACGLRTNWAKVMPMQLDIVDVTALACDETLVLLADDAGANAFNTHVLFSLPEFVGRYFHRKRGEFCDVE